MRPLLLALGVTGGCLAGHEPGDDTVGDVAPGELLLDTPRTCDAPAAQPSWVDRAAEWGVTGPESEGVRDHADGGGVVLFDVDGEGHLDLLLYFARERARLYRWDGTAFDRDDLDVYGWTGTLFDLGDDGDWDVLGQGPHAAWVDVADGTLRAVDTPAADEVYPTVDGSSAKEFSPADVDHDGDLDLFVVVNGNTTDRSALEDYLLRSDGDGAYTRDTSLPASSTARSGFDVVWFDPDDDGWDDAYVANDLGATLGANVYWHNTGGALTDASATCACGLTMNAMGVDTLDYDRDGLWDLHVWGTTSDALLRGLGDGTFVDVTASSRADPVLTDAAMAWGAADVDVDNDGRLDLVVTQGDNWTMSEDDQVVYDSPTNVLIQQPDGTFVDHAVEWGFPQDASFRAAAATDVNDDGVVDVLITEVDGPVHWMVSEGCTGNAWLDVEGPEGSVAVVEAGGARWMARLTTDAGYGVSMVPQAHVGLGAVDTVTRVTVTARDGRSWEARDVAARRRVRVPP